MALAFRSAAAAPGSSRSVSRVFRVRNTRTPRRWQYRTADANSSSVKFFALRRALNAPKPIYTASAPFCTAAVSASYPPRGQKLHHHRRLFWFWAFCSFRRSSAASFLARLASSR